VRHRAKPCRCVLWRAKTRLPFAVRGEDEVLLADNAGQGLEDRGGPRRQRYGIRDVIFCALFRKLPETPGEVELGPPHRTDFVAPLPGQNQQLNKRPERPAKPFARLPDALKLIIAQKTLSRLFSAAGGLIPAHGLVSIKPRAIAQAHIFRRIAKTRLAKTGAGRSMTASSRL
jgi:hypothetical protein